jgi:hypothetical protein
VSQRTPSRRSWWLPLLILIAVSAAVFADRHVMRPTSSEAADSTTAAPEVRTSTVTVVAARPAAGRKTVTVHAAPRTVVRTRTVTRSVAGPTVTRTTQAGPPDLGQGSDQPGDKNWVVQSLNLKDDGLGDFGGNARITNRNGTAQTAVFTFTLYRGSQQLATMEGSAAEVQPGQTVTVDLISSDAYVSGPVRYYFQADVSY